MDKILVLDAHNYDENMDEIYRVAVRGIIFIDAKLLLIENSFGETKLPSGGIEGDEDDVQKQATMLFRTLFAPLEK